MDRAWIKPQRGLQRGRDQLIAELSVHPGIMRPSTELQRGRDQLIAELRR